MIGAELICTGSTSSLTPSALMTHEMDPTMKICPGCGRDEEPTEKVILFDKKTARKPLPGAPTVDRISSAVHRGISHDGRFVGGDARNQEPDGDTRRRDSDLDRFGPIDVIPYVLCLWCIVLNMRCMDRVCRCPPRDPCLSLYTLEW